MILRISQTLILCILFSVCFAQNSPDVFQVDRNSEKKTCYLPPIYFKVNSAEIEDVYLEEMAYIAYVMKKHKKIKISVQAEVSPNPFDSEVKLLTQERLNNFTQLMKERFGIKAKRILQTEYAQLS